MVMYVSKNGYSVYVENDGDDVWVSVRRGGEHLYDCIAGRVNDGARKKEYINAAYSCFYLANYISERMKSSDSRHRIHALSHEACGIDHALEMAMSI